MVTPVSSIFSAPSGTTALAGGRLSGPILVTEFDRASQIIADSGVTGYGNTAIAYGRPLEQNSLEGSGWREPAFAFDGMRGLINKFRFTRLDRNDATNWVNHSPSRRASWSPDGNRWRYFDHTVLHPNGADGYIEMWNDAPFSCDRVYVGRTRQMSVHRTGELLDAYRRRYPTIFQPAASAVAFTPSGTLSPTFKGQDFIAAEYSTQTTALGVSVPKTPFYTALISDPSLQPPGGAPKRLNTIFGGVHAAEDYGDLMMWLFIDALLGNTQAGIDLRTYFDWVFYPMLNAPGRYSGARRGSWQGGSDNDLNRNFEDSLPAALEIVQIPRTALLTDLGPGNGGVIHLAWHSNYEYRWGIEVDELASTQAFRGFLEKFFSAYVGSNTVHDIGDSPPGTTVRYFKSLGAKMSTHMECGDQTTVSDAELRYWALATAQGCNWLRIKDYLN